MDCHEWSRGYVIVALILQSAMSYPPGQIQWGKLFPMKTNAGKYENELNGIFTLKFLDSMMRISAGILSPNFTSTTSPNTKSSARNVNFSPSRMTVANCGTMFLNDSIIFELFDSYKSNRAKYKTSKQFRNLWLPISDNSHESESFGAINEPDSMRRYRWLWRQPQVQYPGISYRRMVLHLYWLV